MYRSVNNGCENLTSYFVSLELIRTILFSVTCIARRSVLVLFTTLTTIYLLKMNTIANSDGVPVLTIPSDERVTLLRYKFYEEFMCKPSFYVRVPGRVNIIGEHIDYCGYSVLPMALEQDIIIAVGILSSPEICIRNVDSMYSTYETEINKINEITPDSNGKPYWYNYVLCGIKGALEYLKDCFDNNTNLRGMNMYVDGNIPPASGLSSSSALVSAACLAFLYSQSIALSKTEIASLCAKSERYIGTQGGGMDQAIAFLAEKYSAQYITFQPLNATPVALPEEATFVVAHSLAELNKAATNDFNRRVIECRLAAKIVAVLEGISQDTKVITLSQVQNNLGNSLEKMVHLVKKHLPKDVYTKEEVCKILNVSEIDMDNLYLTSNTKNLKEFKLKQRALHVYEEAKRVEDFRNICGQLTMEGNSHTNSLNGDTYLNSGDKVNGTLSILGQLISKSHESLKTLYECSHENLDRLVEISKEINICSRLTGAGWGGCIVALCPKDRVEEYIEYLIENFYVNHCNVDRTKAVQYVFATTPNHGARIYV